MTRIFEFFDRAVLVIAALLGLVAVAAGAYGAHGFGDQDQARAARLVATASQYQMWHVLGAIACVALRLPTRVAPLSFLAGIALFSGSLYALALGGPRALAFVTPFGGGLFLLGWAALVMAVLRWSPDQR